MAYDPRTGTVLLAGGIHAPQSNDVDTWSWDGTDWRQLPTTAGPVRDHPSVIATDFVNRSVMLLTCCDLTAPSTPTVSTYEWTGADWGDIPQSGAPENVSCHALASAGSGRGVVNLNPVDTQGHIGVWWWDGSRWSHVAPARAPTVDPLFCEDEVPVLVGVDPVSGDIVIVTPRARANGSATTYVVHGTEVRAVDSAGTPPAVVAMAIDPSSSRLRLFGGPSGADDLAASMTWEGSGWR